MDGAGLFIAMPKLELLLSSQIPHKVVWERDIPVSSPFLLLQMYEFTKHRLCQLVYTSCLLALASINFLL